MKKLTIIVIIFALLLLLTPPLLGALAQSELEEALVQANKQTNSQAELLLENYDKGWFSSSGEIRLQFSDSYLESIAQTSDIDETGQAVLQTLGKGFSQSIAVQHGPILWGPRFDLGLGEAVTTIDAESHPELANLLTQTGQPYLLQSTVTMGLGGTGDLAVDAPPFQYTQNENRWIFAGMQAQGTLALDDMHVIVQGQLHGFSYAGSEGEAVLEQTTFSANMAYPETAPYGLGHAQVAIDRFVALSPAQAAIDLEQAKFAFNSTQGSNNTANINASYEIGRLRGADFLLADLQANIKLTNLDTDALQQMQQLNLEIAAQPENIDPLVAQIHAPLYDVLAAGVGVELNPLQFSLDNRTFKANISLLSKPASLPSKDDFKLDPALLLQDLFLIQAELTLDKTLATELAIPQVKQQLLAGIPADMNVDEQQLDQMAQAQAPLMLSMLVAQGMLRDEGANYSVAAQYEQGTVTINGNPIQLDALMAAGQ